MKKKILLDQTRYFGLLKKKEFCFNSGTTLFDQNFEEFKELISYGSIVEAQLCYNQKAKYIFLIGEYLEIEAYESETEFFIWEFFALFKKNNYLLTIFEEDIVKYGIKKLESFHIDPKAIEFYDLIDEIGTYCECFTFDSQDALWISLDQFRASIQEIDLKLKNFDL